ncbi:hypothetical protein CISIN_1g0336061mg, partial [Citrus sinensis]
MRNLLTMLDILYLHSHRYQIVPDFYG